MPTVVFATWESASWLHFHRTEVPRESGVGAPRPCLGSCLDGLFWNCFLESSRPVVVEKTVEWVCPVAVTLVRP